MHAGFWRDRVPGKGSWQCSGGDVGSLGYILAGRREEGGETEGQALLCRSWWGVLDYIPGMIAEPLENF